MQGIVFYGEGRLDVQKFPDPTPGPNEAVVKIEASGMCGSDLHTLRAPKIAKPVIAGHEPAGIVVEVGTGVPERWLGRRVMVHHYFGCERCDQCRSGWTQLCRNGMRAMGATAPGAHADYVNVPSNCLVDMPDGLTFLAGAAIGCGTGTAWGALKRLNLTGDDTIAIFGQGPVGLSATLLAHSMGARVIALDIAQSRLNRSLEFGASDTIDPSAVDSVADAVRDITNGRGVTKSLETSGASPAARDALHVLATWGVACWVGVGSTIQFDLSEHLYRQVTALTSWALSIPAMHGCANFVVEREIDLDTLFTHTWTLAQAPEAYEMFGGQTAGKGAFVPNTFAASA